MKATPNMVNELRIKFNHRWFDLYIAYLELDYAIFKAIDAINEFGKVASEALNHD